MKSLDYACADAIGVITLTREATRNAIDEILIAELGEAVARARTDKARVLVVTGTGGAFCAGADLKMVTRLMAEGTVAVTSKFLQPLQTVLAALRSLPCPVVAAVNGACYAGGLELVLCCDLVIAAEGARFSDAHARHALLPAVGGVHGLLRTVGPFKAREMLFTGGEYTAGEMQQAGLVSKVVPHAELISHAMKLASRLCQRSPAGLARMKQMVDDEGTMDWATAARYELAITAARLAGSDPHEGLQAFLEKRQPRFTDHP